MRENINLEIQRAITNKNESHRSYYQQKCLKINTIKSIMQHSN